MTIYEIDRAILECVDIETGEIIDEDKLDELRMERNTKIDNLACLHKQLRAEEQAIKAEIKKLHERVKSKENQANKLESYLSRILRGQRFETARNKISWRKSERVDIKSEDFIPEKYFRIQEIRSPMKNEIKKAIKNGAQFKGVELIQENNIHVE